MRFRGFPGNPSAPDVEGPGELCAPGGGGDQLLHASHTGCVHLRQGGFHPLWPALGFPPPPPHQDWRLPAPCPNPLARGPLRAHKACPPAMVRAGCSQPSPKLPPQQLHPRRRAPPFTQPLPNSPAQRATGATQREATAEAKNIFQPVSPQPNAGLALLPKKGPPTPAPPQALTPPVYSGSGSPDRSWAPPSPPHPPRPCGPQAKPTPSLQASRPHAPCLRTLRRPGSGPPSPWAPLHQGLPRGFGGPRAWAQVLLKRAGPGRLRTSDRLSRPMQPREGRNCHFFNAFFF